MNRTVRMFYARVKSKTIEYLQNLSITLALLLMAVAILMCVALTVQAVFNCALIVSQSHAPSQS